MKNFINWSITCNIAIRIHTYFKVRDKVLVKINMHYAYENYDQILSTVKNKNIYATLQGN